MNHEVSLTKVRWADESQRWKCIVRQIVPKSFRMESPVWSEILIHSYTPILTQVAHLWVKCSSNICIGSRNIPRDSTCTIKPIGLRREWCCYLTLYHTIPTFNDPEKVAFWKHCGKRRKCWSPAFSPFPTMFSTLPHNKFQFFKSHLSCDLQMLSIWTSPKFCHLGKG